MKNFKKRLYAIVVLLFMFSAGYSQRRHVSENVAPATISVNKDSKQVNNRAESNSDSEMRKVSSGNRQNNTVKNGEILFEETNEKPTIRKHSIQGKKEDE